MRDLRKQTVLEQIAHLKVAWGEARLVDITAAIRAEPEQSVLHAIHNNPQ